MEERGSKTIMCSVFFLDIVGYSKKSVTGQISLKERFNRYLSAAIEDVPIADRIILDTGDGAAINFLGDIEEALKAALSLREQLLTEDPDIEHPLLVRMGINLGPVRLVRDINGQPNIVGDGINVAQRVMGFADASQILVSRSYYDAISRISPQYAGMFHYQGSRTDKHVREHEVYAIGYPGDKTSIGRATRLFLERSEGPLGTTYARATLIWRSALASLDKIYGQAEPIQKVAYIGAGVISLLLIVLLVYLNGHDDEPARTANTDQSATSTVLHSSGVSGVSPQSELAIMQASSVDVVTERKIDSASKQVGGTGTPIGKASESKLINEAKQKSETKPQLEVGIPNDQPKKENLDLASRKSEYKVTTGGTEAFLVVRCLDGSEVFLDGTKKGRISGSTISIQAPPGQHTVIVSHPSGVDSRNIIFEVGKTVHINPNFCD